MKKAINIIGPLNLNPSLVNSSLFSLIIDGGMNHNLKFSDSISIGDQDSTHSTLDERLPQEKDFSDLAYGLKFIPHDVDEIFCYGFLGGRLDHQMCIIGDILDYLKAHKQSFYFYDQKQVKLILLSAGQWEFSHQGSFSVLSLEQQKFSITGEVKYKLDGEYTKVSPLSSHTLSNQAYGLIHINNESPLTLFLNSPEEI